MARLRYVKFPNQAPPQLLAEKPKQSALTSHTVRSFRAIYKTDPEIAGAVVPKPLTPSSDGHIFVQFAHVMMHVSPEKTIEIGAVTVGVKVSYEAGDGYYVLAMPMEGDFVVIGGRETFGEPKKIAKVNFKVEKDLLDVSVNRHNIDFLSMKGRIGQSKGPQKFTELLYCYKALPTIDRTGFESDPLLVQLEWKRNYTDVKAVDGEILLKESGYDPLIDLPVRGIVSMEYAEGASQTGGKVLRSVPGEWVLPYFGQRYDDPQYEGITISQLKEKRP